MKLHGQPLHPATIEALSFFEYDHLPANLGKVSKPFHDLAHMIANSLLGAQATLALHDLLRSKDCAVRAAVLMEKQLEAQSVARRIQVLSAVEAAKRKMQI